jgi:hypothetical protein
MLTDPLTQGPTAGPVTGFITVVSGLPRSGTSMMMKILAEGGLEPLTDHERAADEDNPRGYYELEQVKKLKEGSHQWLAGAEGKVVKIISALIENLPSQYTYRLVFMHRHIHEILASQKQMLIRRGEPADRVSDDTLIEIYRKHLAQVEAWLAAQENIRTLHISYNEILANPRPHLEKINAFLGGRLDLERMSQVVDQALYRQRR